MDPGHKLNNKNPDITSRDVVGAFVGTYFSYVVQGNLYLRFMRAYTHTTRGPKLPYL